jgi:hypothetical protein
VAKAAWDNQLLYMPKKEIARLQALQSAALIAAKEGGTPHDTLGSDLKTIVLSDEALGNFQATRGYQKTRHPRCVKSCVSTAATSRSASLAPP